MSEQVLWGGLVLAYVVPAGIYMIWRQSEQSVADERKKIYPGRAEVLDKENKSESSFMRFLTLWCIGFCLLLLGYEAGWDPIGTLILSLAVPLTAMAIYSLRRPVKRISNQLFRYWSAGSLVWIFAVLSWYLVFGNHSDLSAEEFGLLAIMPTLVSAIGILAWRWARKVRSQEYEREPQENDPEILYYQAIDSFVRSVGYYEPLLELQGTDKEYCIAVMKVHKAAYLASVPEKIAGALTLDSVKHYHRNREFALVFLSKLEAKWLAESNTGAGQTPNTDDYETEEDADDFHPSLDRAAERVRDFFTDGNGDDLGENPKPELVAYAATYIAMKRSDREMSSVCWNTFKAAIENRMLSIAEDGSQRSGTIKTPNGLAFAHFTSSYWAEMEVIDKLANKAFTAASSSRELASHLFHMLDGHPEQEREFEKLFLSLVEFASKSIFPKVERAFS
jgi:hypothetical protein